MTLSYNEFTSATNWVALKLFFYKQPVELLCAAFGTTHICRVVLYQLYFFYQYLPVITGIQESLLLNVFLWKSVRYSMFSSKPGLHRHLKVKMLTS